MCQRPWLGACFICLLIPVEKLDCGNASLGGGKARRCKTRGEAGEMNPTTWKFRSQKTSNFFGGLLFWMLVTVTSSNSSNHFRTHKWFMGRWSHQLLQAYVRSGAWGRGLEFQIPFRWPWQILVWLWHGYMMLHGWPQDNTAKKKKNAIRWCGLNFVAKSQETTMISISRVKTLQFLCILLL